MSRIVCQFSCGAASAVATKLALAEYGERCAIVNAFIVNEHEDNRRFLADCERWFGVPVTVLRDGRKDALRPVYEATQGADGYVSLEVSPDLAHDTAVL